MELTNNIPAYPTLQQGSASSVWNTFPGMTLLDYFAAKAMQGLVSIHDDNGYRLDGEDTVARDAYSIAVAMLEARKRYIP